jgi:hypothetical protein
MKKQRILILTVFTLFLLINLSTCKATPSSSYTESNGEWFDDWNINRNYYEGENGYLPALAYETLNENKELAYSIGQSFQIQYPQKTVRAETILRFVQQWTEYGYDEDNVFMEGVAQDEWAWNADETAHRFNQTTAAMAIGDCEDLAFLCATIFIGSGFDAAIVDAPGHVALLIWLPEYDNADIYWNIPDDDRGGGWIWVEATGESNPLGWTPPDFEDGNWTPYVLGALEPLDGEDGENMPDGSTDLTDLLSSDIIIPVLVVGAVILVLFIIANLKKSVT